MFVGVMTMALFGVIAMGTHPEGLKTVDKIVLYGAGLGVIGFAIGLLTVSAEIKRVATPVLGTALLIGIGMYIMEMRRSVEDAAS
jgi:hypothetical protein